MKNMKLSSLKMRLFLIVFASTAVIGGCTVLLIIFIAVQNELQESKQQVYQLMDAVEYSAAIAGYSGNKEIANDVIKGLLRSDNVCQARLYNKTGLDIASSKYTGENKCPETIARDLHSPFDEQEIVGHLETRMDNTFIRERARREAGQLAISLLALIILPGLVIWQTIARLITIPIHYLSRQLHQITPGTSARIKSISGRKEDEIVQLAHDVNHLLGVVEDTLIEEREQRLLIKEMKQKYQHLAHHDMLTGLPNRSLFADRLQQMLAQAKRSISHGALVYLDLDKFKPVNDTLGHDVGDLVLKEIAQRLQTAVRESDTVARIGGDEFVVLLPTIESKQDAGTVAEKIRHALDQPFEIGEHTIHIGCSIGIAVYPEHGDDEISLMKNADTAMYQAKQNGRNNVQMYFEGMNPYSVAGKWPTDTAET
ncbi:MAG: diguanylate cyclase [Nitrosomonadales bacterium]|nr:diguanylate cyclase [Nitrosomonadales bacterium]